LSFQDYSWFNTTHTKDPLNPIKKIRVMNTHERFMKKALSLARRGLGSTSPNPVVGALVVKNGRIIGSGYHTRPGGSHAEIEALSRAGDEARGATLYVTLEPCNHYGRTPPCTEAILESGIQRVVVGTNDPNPRVRGGGCDYLRAHGLEVVCGVLREECSRLNEAYIKYVTQGKPFVTVKGALTLDGWIATHSGNSKWITNEKSRRFVHTLRKRNDAIMVGIETIIADDPVLLPYLSKSAAPDPVRVIVDTRLRIPLKSRVLDKATSTLTIIASGSNVSTVKKKAIEGRGAKVIRCRMKNRQIDLNELLERLAEMPICSVLVEGGAALFSSFVRGRIVDKFYLFLAPKLLGGGDGIPFTRGSGCDIINNCVDLHISRLKRFDDDIMIEAYPRESR
jgi:diaminohydroxyphosphoribosylaminopyrimidine deaminase/5-amino-6-(5-phosphoribosylamino)uracil reductase